MSNSEFVIEESDIVRLESGDGGKQRSGWVNIGTHAVQLELDAAGNLVVEVFARCNENGCLGRVTVSATQSRGALGVDPDEDR